MKVCLASWSPFVGGAEVAVERLALGLKDTGCDVLLVVGTEGEALERFQRAGLRCVVCPQQFTDKLGWLKYRRSRNRLVEILRREQPNLVHSNDLPTSQMVGDAARRAGIPHVCHHRFVFDGPAIDWMNKFGAHRHLFVSRALMDELCANSPELSACERAVVYDGLPLPKTPTEEDRDSARAELGLPREKQMVLFAGQIIERKGVADLLHAWAQLDPSWRAKADLYIIGDDLAGDGAYRREMQRLDGDLHCGAHFMGFQKNVDRWLTACNLIMVPSHVEPLGNATLEAMAHARPVIGGNVGGIPEMILHEQTGLLAPPKNPFELTKAITRLLCEPSTAAAFGQAARRRCEELFSLRAHTESVLAQYDLVLAHANVSSRT